MPAKIPYEPRKAHEIEHGKTIAEDAERRWGWDTPAGRRRVGRRARLLFEGIAAPKGGRVLEVGCGTGVFTREVARLAGDPDLQIVALDISPELLARAGQNGEFACRVELVCEDLLEGKQPVASYDAVFGSSILHHVPVPEFFAEFRRLLKPGGRLAFAEPNILNPQIWTERNIRWIGRRLHNTETETAFTRWTLARWLREAGFKDIRVVPHDWLHPWTPSPFIPLIQIYGAICEQIPLVREAAGSLLITAKAPV